MAGVPWVFRGVVFSLGWPLICNGLREKCGKREKNSCDSPGFRHVSPVASERRNQSTNQTMKTTLSTSQAASLLTADNNNGFTYSGAYALCEYLEELEADCGNEIELDPVAIRCDFAEYRCLEYWARDYFGAHWEREIGIARDDSAEEMERRIREYIQDHGILIEFDGGIIVSSF